MGIEAPCYPGEEGTDHEGQELVAGDVLANGESRDLVLPDTDQHTPEGGIDDPTHDKCSHGHEQDDEEQVCPDRLQFETDNRELGDTWKPHRTACQFNPVLCHGIDDYPETEGRQRQIVPFKPHGRETDNKTKERRQ